MANKESFFKKLSNSLFSNIGIKILALGVSLFLFFIIHLAG
ncbi:MAG: hypothetical protein ACI4M6_04685 [Christensenellaceae bacterium]